MTERLTSNSYEIKWIPCKDLSVVWLQSQRKYRESEAKKIVADFDPDLFDPIKVTLPNGEGKYHICDGQHRKAAIEMMWGPEERAPCLVAPDGDPARAALLFIKTNTGRRSPSAIDNFSVSVTAKLPIEVAINRIVQHYKFHIDNTSSARSISAVAALKFVYACGDRHDRGGTGGKKILDQTLQAINDIWPGDPNAVNGNILRGFGAFLNEYGSQIDPVHFRKTVPKKWTPGTLLVDAKRHGEMYRITSTTAAIKDLLLIQYNKGTSKNKKIKPKGAE